MPTCHKNKARWLIFICLLQKFHDTQMQTIFRMRGRLKSTLINYPSFNKGWKLNLRLADYYYQNCWERRHVLFNYSEAKPENTEKTQLMLVDKMIVQTRSQWERVRDWYQPLRAPPLYFLNYSNIWYLCISNSNINIWNRAANQPPASVLQTWDTKINISKKLFFIFKYRNTIKTEENL